MLKHFCIFLMMLCSLHTAVAQSVFGFPTVLEDGQPVIGTQATHEQLRWDDFQDYQDDTIYGKVGKSVGQLMVYYRNNQGDVLKFPCTATLIADGYLLTNYHCVYPTKHDGSGNTYNITTARIYMDYNTPYSIRDEAKAFAVRSTPLEYSENPDYAILETIDIIPFDVYGLKNPRFASYRDSNSLFIVHHSAENLDSDHKRLTARDCQALNFSRVATTPIATPDGIGQRAAIEGRDIPHFCDTKGGASGSLVFNSRGEIVGLNFAGLRNKLRGRLIPESSRFNLFIDIQAVAAASNRLEEIMFGITQQPNRPPQSATQPNRPPVQPTPPAQTVIRTADELVRRARQGGTLRLAATTFRLNETLELSGDVRLIGQGYEQTRIVSTARNSVVHYTGGGTFAAEGIGFEYVGNQAADVVHIDNGRLAITHELQSANIMNKSVWKGLK